VKVPHTRSQPFDTWTDHFVSTISYSVSLFVADLFTGVVAHAHVNLVWLHFLS
jgi:hypothetical protein